MSPFVVGLISLGLLFLLLALGIPIYACFALAGFFGYIFLVDLGASLSLFGMVPFSWGSHYVLITIPLFILMGMFIHHSGISQELFDFCNKLLGRLPGTRANSSACIYLMKGLSKVNPPLSLHSTEAKLFNSNGRISAFSTPIPATGYIPEILSR